MKYQTRKGEFVYIYDTKMGGVYRDGVELLERYLTALNHLNEV
jgi:hypothetical protein